MAKFLSERNLKFLLYEVFDVERLTQHPHYLDHNREIFDLVLETAMRLSGNLLRGMLEEMDRQVPEYFEGKVKVHPKVRDLMLECGEGGWIGSSSPYELGGQQLPLMISSATTFIFAAANY